MSRIRTKRMDETKRKALVDDFNSAPDLFTTCQKCRSQVPVGRVGGKFVPGEHDCADREGS